jgi:hypothetical protein
VHHLNESRSQRALWLLEELGLPCEIRHYTRDASTARPRAACARVTQAIDAWVRCFQQRPAYRRALERGGPYSMAD